MKLRILTASLARKEGGKKDERADRADKAGKGKFGTVARPSHLRAVN